MLSTIAKPFGILLLWLNNLVGNYGIAILLFALVVKLIMLPFQMKSKKSMLRMNALNPQIQELQKRHEGNPRKLQEETSKLYKEEHINPMSGCLWNLIPFPILIALYQAIRYPLTVMMRVPKELLSEGGAILTRLEELGFSSTANAAYVELQQSQFISAHFDQFRDLSDKLVNINYNFLGINLGDMPKLKFWVGGVTWASVGLVLIPILSAFLSWLQSKVSMPKTDKADDAKKPNTQADQQAAQAKSMSLMMPLISLYIGFILPAALGIYWIYGSVFGILQDLILNKIYGKQLAAESAERDARMRARQAEWERKRQETERLKAEGKTQENANTSKKKQQARQKAELDELRAAAIREERAAKRAAMGLPPEEELPASQVGDRRFARGRAYVPDRFTNPDAAEAATAAAAAESELYDALYAPEAPDAAPDAATEAEPVEAVERSAADEDVSDDVDEEDALPEDVEKQEED